jgi:hypothetical protein
MANRNLAAAYGPKTAALMEGRVASLGPGKPNRAVYEQLRGLTTADLAPGSSIADNDMAQSCLAGLWLLHDFLDESHQISQQIETTTGSYWHGIMHRRELDFDNAKYWFRRVGRHEVFGPLADAARELAQAADAPVAASFADGTWDAFRFVDLCRAAREDTADESILRQIAQREWELLFEFCYRRAVGE